MKISKGLFNLVAVVYFLCYLIGVIVSGKVTLTVYEDFGIGPEFYMSLIPIIIVTVAAIALFKIAWVCSKQY